MEKSVYDISLQICDSYLPCFFGNELTLFKIDDRYGQIKCNSVEAVVIQAINRYHSTQRTWLHISELFNIRPDNTEARATYETYVNQLRNKGIVVPGKAKSVFWGEQGKCYPLFLTIELTNFCNFRCTHCYKEAGPTNTTFISIDTIRDIFDTLKDKTYSLELTGGEATAHPLFDEIVAIAPFTNIFLLTNGSNICCLDNATLRKLNHVQVSMYGVTDDEYRQYAGVCAFSAFCDGLKKLVQMRIPSSVAIILRKDNVRKIDQYLTFLYEIGINNVRFGVSAKAGRNTLGESGWDISVEEYNIASQLVAAFSDKHPDMQIAKLDDADELKSKINDCENYILGCQGGKNMICISEAGLVRPCVMLPEKYFGKVLWSKYKQIIASGNVFNYDKFIPEFLEALRMQGRNVGSVCPYGFVAQQVQTIGESGI